MRELINKLFQYALENRDGYSLGGIFLFCLTLLSRVYKTFMIYRAKHAKKIPASAFNTRIISIGNITLGGTGKTPLTAWLANHIVFRGKKCGIVLRGYGRKMKTKNPLLLGVDHHEKELDYFGDEALLLRELAPHASIVVCADRVSAINRLGEAGTFDYTILDDGFQQVHLPKFIDLVCLDPKKPFGNEAVVPRGNLREPLSAMERATHFVFPKGRPRKRFLNMVTDIAHEKPVFVCEYTVTGAYKMDDPLTFIDLKHLQNKNGLILTGIGNPESLKHSLDSLDITGVYKLFPDHFPFYPETLMEIDKEAIEKKYDFILVTEKDSVKLKTFSFSIPCYIIEGELIPEPGFVGEMDRILGVGNKAP